MRPTGGASASGSQGQTQLALGPDAAFQAALQAIGAAGGQVVAQDPPRAARFRMVRKSALATFGIGVVYDGDLTLQPLGPGQVNVAVSLKINWSTVYPIMLIGGVFALMTLIFPYGLGILGVLLIGLATAYTCWQLSSQTAEGFIRQILTNLGGTPVAPAAPVYVAPPPPPPAPTPAPTPPPAAAPPPVVAAPPPVPPHEEDDPDEIMDQIKRLAELRDAGALTSAEFDAKKAELLARI